MKLITDHNELDTVFAATYRLYGVKLSRTTSYRMSNGDTAEIIGFYVDAKKRPFLMQGRSGKYRVSVDFVLDGQKPARVTMGQVRAEINQL